MWFLPAVTDHARTRWAFDLAPYHPAILSAFCVLGPPLLISAVLALQLLDDKDQQTLTALRVTPVPPAVYPAYRATVTAALTTVSVVASPALTGQVDGPTLALSVPVAVVAGLLAPVLGFVMASLGRTKIEGLAVMRVVGSRCSPCRSSRSSSSTSRGSSPSVSCRPTGRCARSGPHTTAVPTGPTSPQGCSTTRGGARAPEGGDPQAALTVPAPRGGYARRDIG